MRPREPGVGWEVLATAGGWLLLAVIVLPQLLSDHPIVRFLAAHVFWVGVVAFGSSVVLFIYALGAKPEEHEGFIFYAIVSTIGAFAWVLFFTLWYVR